MRAFKCDRCGKYFDPGDKVNMDSEKGTLYICTGFRTDDTVDLCPKCARAFEAWWRRPMDDICSEVEAVTKRGVFMGSVDTLKDLEDVGIRAVGDVWTVRELSKTYIWMGTEWKELRPAINPFAAPATPIKYDEQSESIDILGDEETPF